MRVCPARIMVRRHGHPWEFKRVASGASLGDPDLVYAGVEDAALFKSFDGGATWESWPGCAARYRTGVQPAQADVPHTIILDPSNAERMYIAISAAGAFARQRRQELEADQTRGWCQLYPQSTAEVGHVFTIWPCTARSWGALHAEALE